MQLDELNPNIYTIFKKKLFFDVKNSKKSTKTQGSGNLTFLEKSAYSFFTKCAIALKDFFLNLHDKLLYRFAICRRNILRKLIVVYGSFGEALGPKSKSKGEK